MLDLSLYVITDSVLSKGRSNKEVVTAAIAGGATVIQLREKECGSLDFYRKALDILEVTRRTSVPLIINDRVDIALAVDADGVHVGQEDLPAAVVRNLIGENKILGVSASTVEEAIAAVKDGADYIGVGAIYATKTKADAGEAVGIARIKEIAAAVDIPIVAIGGITRENVTETIKAGAKGAAVVSAIVAADDIEQAAKKMKEIIEQD